MSFERADHLVLLYGMFSCFFFVNFTCDVLGQVWSIPDLCLLPYFHMML